MRNFFGIDFGGTSVKLAVLDARGRIVWDANVPSSGHPKPAEIAAEVGAIAAPVIKKRKIKRVGVGVAGDIDFDRGVVRISPNLGWKNVPLRRLLKKYISADVIVDNDANVAAWGIYKTQAPVDVRNIVVITLGTGVGGGIILDGRLYRGATGSAGEIGHMVMNEHGRQCNCGMYGCLETYAGGTHIVKTAREAIEKGQSTQLTELYRKNPALITPRAIAQAARAGDGYSLGLWQQVGHMLGIAIGNIIYTLNPEMIYLAGGVAQAKGLILRPLWKTLALRPFKTPVNSVSIKIADNTPTIGVIGAALL